jgi:hypothetical protein
MNTGIHRIYKHESVEFTTVPNWVVRSPDYSANAFRLLAYLLSHAEGYELTYAQIERQTTLGRWAINEAAKFLIGEGWLEWDREKGSDGRWLAKKWIIKDPNSTVGHSTMEPFHYGAANGHIEKQVKEKNTIKRKTLSESQEKELFSEFWKDYPKKVDKGAAFRAFRSALNRASFEDIVAGALQYANDPNLPDAKYIKNPATWLNADAWENGPLPEDPKRQKEREKKENEERMEKWLREQD